MSIQINVDPNIQHLIQGFEKGINQFNARAASKAKLKVGIDEKSFTRPLGRITGQVNMFESAMEAANARVIAFGASTAVLASVTKVLKDIVKTSIEVEAAFADINRILGLTATQFEKFGNQLFDTAQKTASSFQAASSAALEFSRQGLKTEEVLKRTSDALTLVRLTGINAEKAVSLLTATVNAFTDLDTTSAVNKFVAVETKFAVAARDLVEGLSRVGSAAQDAKVDFDELNALITSVQQTTGRGGAVIGNALKTIFTRLQRESTLEALERFNVGVRDIQGNILPATRILDNFAEKYSKLTDSTQAYLREQVAGVFQANILSAILKDLNKEQSTFSKALAASTGATNEAEQANYKLNQTLSALLQNTSTEFAKLQKTLGNEAFLDLAKGIVSAFGSVVSGINKMLDPSEGSDIAKGFLKGFANVLQGPLLIGAIKVLYNVGKQSFGFLTQALPVLLNITTASAKRAQTEEFINKLLSSDVKLAQQIYQAEGNQAKQLELVLQRSRAITAQFERQRSLSAGLSTAIVGGGSFITGSGVKGSTVKNKAGGYMPSIRAEQGAISRGVGGAGNGAYPVVIPNFAFGGGKVGPVVANSSEVMVPNYGGSGGSAIFNQDMISRYGMPAGAVPIAAAGYTKTLGQSSTKERLEEGMALSPYVHAKDRLKVGYDDEFSYPFRAKRRNETTKQYGDEFEALVAKEAQVRKAGYKLAHTAIGGEILHGGPNSAIDLVKVQNGVLKGIMEVKAGGFGTRATAGKTYRAVGENIDKKMVAGMFRGEEGEHVPYETILVTNSKRNINVNRRRGLMTASYTRGASGYIPRFAAGRMPLGSLASAANISSASAQNPNIHPEDLVKTGYDNHISLPIRSVMKRGMSPKVYGDKVEAEVAKNPKIKAMGYRLAHGGELYGNDNSAVDLIKTEGGILKGVMEVKGGELKAPAALKTGRVISENLSRPMVRGMFQGPPGEKIAYDTHLITNARRGIKPQNIAGMMRRGATMARGYVPNLANGLSPMDVGIGAQAGRQIENLYGSNLQKYFYNLQGGLIKLADITKLNANQQQLLFQSLRTNARSVDAVTGSNQALIHINQQISDAKKRNAAAINKNTIATNNSTVATAQTAAQSKGMFAGMRDKMKGLVNSPGASMALMMGAPMAAGFLEQMISQGRSRTQMSEGQRFSAGAVSDVTSLATSGGLIGGLPGAVVGGLIGLGKAALGASLSIEELEQKAEEYRKTTEQVSSAGEQFIQAQKDMATASTQEEYANASKRASDSLKTLKDSGDNLYRTFYDNAGSIDKLATSLKKYETRRALQGALQTPSGATSLAGLLGLEGVDAKEMIKTLRGSGGANAVDLIRSANVNRSNTALGQTGSKTGYLLDWRTWLMPLQSLGFGDPYADATNAVSGQNQLIGLISEGLKSSGMEQSDIETILKDLATYSPERVADIYENLISGLREALGNPEDAKKAAKDLARIFNFNEYKNGLMRMDKDLSDFIRSATYETEAKMQFESARQSALSGILDPITQASFEIQRRKDEFAKDAAQAADEVKSSLISGLLAMAAKKPGEGTQRFINDVLLSFSQGKSLDRFGRGALLAFGEEDSKAFRAAIQQDKENKQRFKTRGKYNRLTDFIQMGSAQEKKRLLDEQFINRRYALQRSVIPSTLDLSAGRSARSFEAQMSSLQLSSGTLVQKISREMALRSDRGKTLEEERLNRLGYDLDEVENARNEAIRQLESERSRAIMGAGPENLASINENFARKQKEINDKAIFERERIEKESLNEKEKIESQTRDELAQLRRTLEHTRGKGSFGRGMTDAFNTIDDNIATFDYRLGNDIPMKFRDGMVSAMEAALDRTDDLGSALRGIATEFLSAIRGQMIGNIVDMTMSTGRSMFKRQTGGVIRAQNGMYISGGRTGDKNPALLEDGEYVLNRNAVSALGGPAAIDRLNFGIAPRFAGGGAFINKDPLGSQMSARYGYMGDPLLDEIKQAAAARDAKRAQKRAERKALLNSIISTAVMAGVSFAVGGYGSGSGSGGEVELTKTGNAALDASGQQTADMFNKGLSYDMGSAGTIPMSTPISKLDWSMPSLPTPRFGRMQGGYISSGPRNIDSIPTFMAGGEFVMNNKAVKKYGLGFMSRLNGGYIPKYQAGGSVAEVASELGSNNATNTNNINISINMGGSGSEQSSNNSQGNGQGSASDDQTRAKELSRKIKQVVVQTIRDEQRVGGSLSKTGTK